MLTPAKAYVEICKNKNAKALPLCYYLYSLQGAVSHTDWRSLNKETKDRLKKEVAYLLK